MRLLLLSFGLLLAACAPSTAVCDPSPQTAFVGEVTYGAAPDSSPDFYVLERGLTYLVTTDARTNFLGAGGERLEVAAVTPGTRVWVQGTLLEGEVQADEVRVLGG